jgi:hypothetical protein
VRFGFQAIITPEGATVPKNKTRSPNRTTEDTGGRARNARYLRANNLDKG